MDKELTNATDVSTVTPKISNAALLPNAVMLNVIEGDKEPPKADVQWALNISNV